MDAVKNPPGASIKLAEKGVTSVLACQIRQHSSGWPTRARSLDSFVECLPRVSIILPAGGGEVYHELKISEQDL